MRTLMGSNPKHEDRNPKQIQNPKKKIETGPRGVCIVFLLVIRACFEFRVSDFVLPHSHCLSDRFPTQYAPYLRKGMDMAEDTTTAPDMGTQQPQGVQVLLDERELRSLYAN